MRKVSSAILLERARDKGQRTGMSMPHTSAACRVTPPTAWKAQLPFSDGWETITARHGRAAARGQTAPILSPNSCLAKFEAARRCEQVLVHSVPVEVVELSPELLHVHSSTLGDPYTVAKPPIGTNHEVADFATPQRLTELPQNKTP